MNVEINIDEEEIKKLIMQSLSRNIMKENAIEYIAGKQGIKKGVEEAVKTFIYVKKEEIIEEVIERATKEIVKKALPILINKNMEVQE